MVAQRKGATITELAIGWVLRQPEISVALVGGKSPEQIEANSRYVSSFSEEDIMEINSILEKTPEISWEITNGGMDNAEHNDARAKVGLPLL